MNFCFYTRLGFCKSPASIALGQMAQAAFQCVERVDHGPHCAASASFADRQPSVSPFIASAADFNGPIDVVSELNPALAASIPIKLTLIGNCQSPHVEGTPAQLHRLARWFQAI